MTTAGDLVTEISNQLHGWGATRDRITSLAADVAPGDFSFTVSAVAAGALGLEPGPVEIGSELIYVASVDSSTGVCTVAPGFGRGYGGTTAAAHSAGGIVTTNPRFPRANLLKQINEVIGMVWPALYAVGTYTGTVQYPSNTYNLGSTIGKPNTALVAQWQDTVGNWRNCPAYMIDPADGSFRLGSGAMIGRPLRVVYTAPPTKFTAETDNYTLTGLPDSCADVLMLGVVARMIPGLDISRVQTTSVEQSDRQKQIPPGAGVNAAKYLMAEFQDRLQDEAQALRKQYKPRLVKVW